MPHPNERRILIQIQVYPGQGSALKALADGLEGLKQVCEVVKTRFNVSFDIHLVGNNLLVVTLIRMLVVMKSDVIWHNTYFQIY